MKKKTLTLLVTALAFLALAGIAQAHVTVHPNALPAGAFTVVRVVVPNERDKASTVKVDVQLPAGIYFASTGIVPGWKATLSYRKLAKPVTVFGSKITREAGRLTFRSAGGRIGPGQFAEFPLSIRVPTAKTGTRLSFKALQTYSNGEVVRWIGGPSSEEPAPQILVRADHEPVQDYAELPGGGTHKDVVFALPVLLVAALGLGLWRRLAS